MLKSKFKISYDDDEVEEEQEVQDGSAVQDAAGRAASASSAKKILIFKELTKSDISVRCSMLGKTAEGDGYTYLKCNLTGLKVTSIKTIKRYQNLMFLDVSHNLLDLDALQVIAELPFLILIQADDNILTSAAIKPMKYLQCIIMNDNQITSVNDVFQVELSTLELGGNRIETVAFENKMQNLKVLDFRNNIIADISNFDFPLLDSLYLAGNKLKTLIGIEKLVNLRILHVRNNPIKVLNGFDEALTKLTYINLRNCKVGTLIQIKKLRVLKGLETLVIKGCPYMGGTGEEEADVKGDEDDSQLRIETIAALPRLKRLNKYIVTDEERAESKILMLQWIEEGEVDEEEIEAEQLFGEEETHNEDQL